MKIEELQTVLGLICEYTDTIDIGYDEYFYFAADMPTDVCMLLAKMGWKFEICVNYPPKLTWSKENDT